MLLLCYHCWSFFFFNDTATTEIYTLSLHDALPISTSRQRSSAPRPRRSSTSWSKSPDRKSTRLNSSHQKNSYAVFCLKKKNQLRWGKGWGGGGKERWEERTSELQA